MAWTLASHYQVTALNLSVAYFLDPIHTDIKSIIGRIKIVINETLFITTLQSTSISWPNIYKSDINIKEIVVSLTDQDPSQPLQGLQAEDQEVA